MKMELRLIPCKAETNAAVGQRATREWESGRESQRGARGGESERRQRERKGRPRGDMDFDIKKTMIIERGIRNGTE